MIGTDLFAGAGGMSLGAVYAGIDVRLAVDIDKHATATYAHNHRDTKVLVNDVRDVVASDLPDAEGPTILLGGPPCQGFSTSNQRTRNTENPKNWLFLEFVRIAKLWEPDWIVFENVKGICETAEGVFLKVFKEGLHQLGYTLTDWTLNAAYYGVPQNRCRYFLIGSKHGLHVTRPEPTVVQPVTVKEAIYDLPSLENGARFHKLEYRSKPHSAYASNMRNGTYYSFNNNVTDSADIILERYRHVPKGGNWQNIPIGLMSNYKDRRRCHTGIYHRLNDKEPSVVIGNYRKNMLIHPSENRGLSVREAARIQSFPDWYEFIGSIGFQQQQVSDAVPPFLAKAVFESLKEAVGQG